MTIEHTGNLDGQSATVKSPSIVPEGMPEDASYTCHITKHPQSAQKGPDRVFNYIDIRHKSQALGT